MAFVALAGCGGDDDGTTGSSETATQPSTVAKGGGVRLEKVGDFDEPLFVSQPPGSDDLFVVERAGKVRIVRDGGTIDEPFLDISDNVTTGGERGLLSIAFPPDYAESGLFYVFYTDSKGDEIIDEFKRSDGKADTADPDSQRELFHIEDFAPNHNGGLLTFGPDNYLYAGTGDGGLLGDPQRNGQNLNALLGKLLRVDPHPDGDQPYTIPKDNPFVGRSGARPEIYAYGLRNPWRYAFDTERNDLIIADVGQNRFEEIDIVPTDEAAGANFGWSAFEGDARLNEDQNAPGAVRPAFTYGRDRGCSITGGYVVRDPELPKLSGRYVYGDFCTGDVSSLVPNPGKATDDRPLGVNVPQLSSFGEDGQGRIYATSLDGPVYRLRAKK